MKKYISLGFFLLCFGTTHAASLSAERYTYFSLLLSKDPGQIRLGASSIAQDAMFDREALDLVAEVLSTKQTLQTDKLFTDSICWLVKTIGISGQPRYRPFLQMLNKKANNDKFAKYAKIALDTLNGETDVFFEEGKTDTRAIQLSIDVMKKENNIKSIETPSDKLSINDSLAKVYTRLGVPDYINDSDIHVGGREHWMQGIVSLNLHAMDIYYYDKKLILRMQYSPGQIASWHVTHIAEEIPHPPQIYSSDNISQKHFLMVNNSKMLQSLVLELDKLPNVDPELFDTIADRLWLSAETTDSLEVDAMSRLCRVLGKSKNMRYLPVLTDVAKAAQTHQLSRYAQKSLTMLTNETGTRYQRRPIHTNSE